MVHPSNLHHQVETFSVALLDAASHTAHAANCWIVCGPTTLGHSAAVAATHPPVLHLPIPVQPGVLYSGADDATFKGWDVRAVSSCDGGGAAHGAVADDAAPQQAPIFSNKKAHGAGVCCISSHPRRPHCLVTGSYDEAVRLWDVRMVASPVETCQVHIASDHK